MAKQSNVTLDEFIKKYTQSKKKSQKTYSEWLSERGDLSETSYANAVSEAQKEYDRARSGYGKTGEELSRIGLNGSGYASFLDSQAYSELQNSKREAEKARNTAKIKNRSAYASYLENADAAQNKLVRDTISDIYRFGSDDYESSYKLAIASGLDEEVAKSAAEIGASLAKDAGAQKQTSVHMRRSLIKELMSGGIPKSQRVAFLMACGLSEQEATEMADAVEKIMEKGSSSGGESLFD